MKKEEPQPGTDCIPVARTLARAINRSKPGIFDAKFDYDAFADRMIKGTPLTSQERSELRDFLRREFSVGRQLCDELAENGGEHTLLHMRHIDGVPHVLVRVRYDNGAFSYYDLIFGYKEFDVNDVEIRDVMVKDIYFHSTGEMLSKAIRPGFNSARNRFFLESMMGKERDTSFADILRYADTLRSVWSRGEFEPVRHYYNSMPGAFRRERALMSLYVGIAREAGINEYLSAIGFYVGNIPHGAGGQMLLIEKYTIQEKYDSLIVAINRLDSIVDGDPYLRYLRGAVYLRMGDTTSGKRWLKSAIKEEPMLSDPYWPLIDILVRERDFSEAIRYVNARVLWFKQPVAEVEQRLIYLREEEPRYAEFMKSEDYAEWMNKRMGRSDAGKEKTDTSAAVGKRRSGRL